MGEGIINMLNVITTGRNAAIILSNNSLSRNFELETGAPQGNSPPPLQYVFAEQIAIFKLELDPQIASIFAHHLVPRPFPAIVPAIVPQIPEPVLNPLIAQPAIPPLIVPPPNEGILIPADENGAFCNESNRKTNIVDSFADDKTATFIAEREALVAITGILDDFGTFSGLVCNKKKSAIMFVGGGGSKKPTRLSKGI